MGICITLAASQAGPQLQFSNSKPMQQDKPSDDGVNTRLGLLAGQLGLDPIAHTQGSSSSSSNTGVSSNSGFSSTNSVPSTSSQNADFTSGSSAVASGRIPGDNGQQCCCVPNSEICEDPFSGPDLVGSGAIDPRLKNNTRTLALLVKRLAAMMPTSTCLSLASTASIHRQQTEFHGLKDAMRMSEDQGKHVAQDNQALAPLGSLLTHHLESFHGLVCCSIRTMTLLVAVLSFLMTSAMTIQDQLGKSSLQLTN